MVLFHEVMCMRGWVGACVWVSVWVGGYVCVRVRAWACICACMYVYYIDCLHVVCVLQSAVSIVLGIANMCHAMWHKHVCLSGHTHTHTYTHTHAHTHTHTHTHTHSTFPTSSSACVHTLVCDPTLVMKM